MDPQPVYNSGICFVVSNYSTQVHTLTDAAVAGPVGGQEQAGATGRIDGAELEAGSQELLQGQGRQVNWTTHQQRHVVCGFLLRSFKHGEISEEQLSAGGYLLQKEKLPSYVVPDLTGFKVCTTALYCLFILQPSKKLCLTKFCVLEMQLKPYVAYETRPS